MKLRIVILMFVSMMFGINIMRFGLFSAIVSSILSLFIFGLMLILFEDSLDRRRKR